MVHLLDTDVVWALRNPRDETSGSAVMDWASALLPSTLYVSVVSVMEFEAGASKLERKETAAASAIRAWVETRLRPAFEGRILPVDEEVVRRWVGLGCPDPRDGLLAATALEHGLTLATRHGAAFKRNKVKTCNPWSYASESAELDWRQASQSAPLWLKNLFIRA